MHIVQRCPWGLTSAQAPLTTPGSLEEHPAEGGSASWSAAPEVPEPPGSPETRVGRDKPPGGGDRIGDSPALAWPHGSPLPGNQSPGPCRLGAQSPAYCSNTTQPESQRCRQACEGWGAGPHLPSVSAPLPQVLFLLGKKPGSLAHADLPEVPRWGLQPGLCN